MLSYAHPKGVFPFDSKRQKFFFLDIVQQFASPTSSITLYGIDPATGSSTATPVKGATGFVMSFVYHPESGDMVMAVGSRSDATTKFYRVNLDTVSAVCACTKEWHSNVQRCFQSIRRAFVQYPKEKKKRKRKTCVLRKCLYCVFA